MEGRQQARVLLPARIRKLRRDKTQGRAANTRASLVRHSDEPRVHSTAEAETGLDEADLALFEALRAHRLIVARAEAVPPFVVASDRTLRDMARVRPQTESELLSVHGMGPVKAARYGAGFLSVTQAQA
jgi:ATP-dependent DNA helicase RecQ